MGDRGAVLLMGAGAECKVAFGVVGAAGRGGAAPAPAPAPPPPLRAVITGGSCAALSSAPRNCANRDGWEGWVIPGRTETGGEEECERTEE